MRFRCDQCNAQYAIADSKVGPKGVRVRCKKCENVITVKQEEEAEEDPPAAEEEQAAQREQTEVSAGAEDGFNPGEDELDSAMDEALDAFDVDGDEEGEDEDQDFDRQSTRVFSVEAMQQVQEEKDEAAQRAHEKEQISDIYHQAKESEEAETYAGSPQANDAEALDSDRVEWYVAVDERQIGPMAASELGQRYSQGEFDADTLVWKNGFDDWLPVFEVQELASLSTQKEESAPDESWEEPTSEMNQAEHGSLGQDQEEPFAEEEYGYGDRRQDESVPEEEKEPAETEDADGDGLFDDERYASASAAAFEGADGDWQPSALADLDALAEEELKSLRPPEAESEEDGLEGLLGDDDDQALGQDNLAGEMDDGDSSIIGQIAAEEESAARLAEQERAEIERQEEKTRQKQEEAKKKQEDDALAAQEAARQEREEEQRKRVAPPAELPPRGQFPRWAMYSGFGLLSVLIMLAGYIAVNLPMGRQPVPSEVEPVAPAETVAAADKKPGAKQKPLTPVAKPEAKVETATGAQKSPASAVPPKEAKFAEASVKEKPAPRKKVKSPPAVSKRRTSTASKRKTYKTKELASVIKEPEPPSKPAKKRKKSSGGLLDFEDQNAFARETGSEPVVVKAAPKKVKKKLPPLTNADVLSVMRKHLAEFKACNRKQREVDNSVRGKMVVEILIETSGKVKSARVTTAQFRSTFVAGCISKVIKQARFPEFGGKTKKIPFPFTVK